MFKKLNPNKKLLKLPLQSEARVASVQSFTLWQQAKIEIMRHNHSITA